MINIYSARETDFASLGLAALEPIECTVEEQAGGKFELTLTHLIDDDLKWTYFQVGNILKAPCATRQTPLMRITDNVSAGTTTTKTRAIYKVQTSTGERLRLRAKPSLNAKIISSYKPGTQVVRLSVSGDWARVIVRKGGATGYMWADDLVFVKNETETVTGSATVETVSKVIEPAQTREQLFRIYSVSPDVKTNTITVLASHISYDLQGVIVVGACTPKETSAKDVIDYALAHASANHDFNIYCTVTTPITADYSDMSLVKMLLDPESGIVRQTNARIIRDNYDLYIVPDETLDRGAEIRHRKNLLGAVMTTDTSGVVTRILPIGRDKDGDRLWLTENGGWVISPHQSAYPIAHDAAIEYDVSVGKGEGQFSTNDLARAELKKRAEADFASGIDLAKVSLEVEFVALENTREYADYAPLLALFLYDTVHVIAAYAGINARLRVNGYVYDCLLRRYDSVQLGEIVDIEQTTYGYEIAEGSVTGSRILPGSVDGNTIMRRASIGYAKIAQAAIEQLAADAIVAVRADIHEIVSGSVTTDALYADLAELAVATITTASIQNANIDWAEIQTLSAEIARISAAQIEEATISAAQITDLNAAVATIADARIADAVITTAQIENLNAAIAEVVALTVSTGTFDLAAIKNLLSSALILQEGVADSMMITNLAVTSANLMNATIDKLVLKGADGKYYRVFIGADGTIQTEEVTVTDGEIAAGETEEGRQIVATTANVGSLNATTIKASEAIIGTIFTESLTAGKITANEALIAAITAPSIYTTAITALGNSLDLSANESIRLTVGSSLATATVEYALSDSRTEAPETGWTATAPEWTDGKYMWQRTTWTKRDGTKSVSDPTCIAGATGAKGDQGIQGIQGEQGVPGTNGNDGKTTYFHIKYAPVQNPTASQMAETPDVYIGTYVDFTADDSTNPSDYTWARFEGAQGEKGIPGTNGTDGKTYYLHIAYATSADGSTGFSTTDSAGKTYIGTCTDENPDDPTTPASYKWSHTKGEDGTGIASVTAEYYLSTSKDEPTGGEWLETPPTWTTGKYMWTRTKIAYKNPPSTETTEPVCDSTWEITNGLKDDIDAVSSAAETALGLAEVAQDAANGAQETANDAQEAANQANERAGILETQLTLTREGLSVIQTETIPGLEGRVETIESGVHISGAEIGIYTGDSPFRNTITNSGWVISEDGAPIITCAETKLTAPRIVVSDALMIGGLAWKPGTDGHVRLLKYGR